MDAEQRRGEAFGVARRPAKGSIGSFLRDLRALLGFGALKRTVQEFQRDDILSISAGLAYYLILALFPFILVLFAVVDTFSSPESVTGILDYFRRVMPREVFGLIDAYTQDTLQNRDTAPGLLSFGILGTIWAASGAFSAFINALNKAYDVEETRPFWKVRGIAILMTLGLSVLVLAGVLLLVFGPGIGGGVATLFGLGSLFESVWNVARWPAALFFMVITVALLYYFAPDAGQPFRWITPGGIIGVLLWVLASVAFSLYVNNFGSYDQTYGSIGTVIVLLLYLYISSITILFGAELNATLVRMKEEISGEYILDAEPADNKPDILDEDRPDGIREGGRAGGVG